MKANEMEERFDNGEDVLEYFDLSTMTRPNLVPQALTVNFPTGIVTKLDEEAKRLGVTRDSLINAWVAEHLSLSEEQKKAS